MLTFERSTVKEAKYHHKAFRKKFSSKVKENQSEMVQQILSSEIPNWGI